MGQMTLGILYGIEAPALPRADDYDEPLDDLLVRFHEAAGLPLSPSSVDQEHDGGKDLLGVWVAVGASGKEGTAFFLEDAVPLTQVETLYAEAIVEAKVLWDRFSTYCAAQEQLVLPAAILWITPTEVA